MSQAGRFSPSGGGGGFVGSPVAFLYELQSNTANVTGDGTVYQLGSTVALTKLFDLGSNTTTAGVFTAPTTGTYFLGMTILAHIDTTIDQPDQIKFQIITTGRTYVFNDAFDNVQTTGGSTTNFGSHYWSLVVQMSAGDTATFNCSTDASPGGGSQGIDTLFVGNTNASTSIMGYQVA